MEYSARASSLSRAQFFRQEEPSIIRIVSETNPRTEKGTDVTMGGQFSGTNPDISPPTGSQQSASDLSSPVPDNHNIQYLYAIIPKQLMTGHFKKRKKDWMFNTKKRVNHFRQKQCHSL